MIPEQAVPPSEHLPYFVKDAAPTPPTEEKLPENVRRRYPRGLRKTMA